MKSRSQRPPDSPPVPAPEARPARPPEARPAHTPEGRPARTPGGNGDRRLPLSALFALVALLVVGITLAIAFALLSRQPFIDGIAAPPASTDNPDAAGRLPTAATADALTAQAATLLGLDGQTGSGWPVLLERDASALGLYLQRLATAPAYLRQNKDDAAFAADFWGLIQTALPPYPTTAPADGLLPVLPPPLTPSQSRIDWLARALTVAGGTVPPSWRDTTLGDASGGAALGALSLEPGVPKSGDVVFGRRLLNGSIQMSVPEQGNQTGAGLSFRTLLLLNGRAQAATPLGRLDAQSDPAARSAAFALPLDMRGRNPGIYQTEIIVLASDGRGRHADLGRLEVPMIQRLSSGSSLDVALPSAAQPGGAVYAAIDPQAVGQNWRYELTVANPSVPVAGELFSLDGERIAFCDSPDTRWEGLRAVRPADRSIPEADRVAYARVGRTSSDGVPAMTTPGDAATGSNGQAITGLGVTLVQAARIAVPLANPDQLQVVVDQNGDQVTVQDRNGNRRTRPAAEFDLVTFPARLSQLAISTGSTTVAFYPDFDAETDTFGLYVPADAGSLTMRASAREGSFATLSATVSGLTTAPAPSAASAPSATPPAGPAMLEIPLSLAAGEQTLNVAVRNGDGEERTYRVHILKGPPPAGAPPGDFLQVVEAFPVSYRSPLYLLHVRHPAYRFVPHAVDVDFAAFAAAQTERDRSLVDAATVAESWVKPGSPVYDGRSWKAAAPEVVAYFADPRNFLNERDVFQFEHLRFQPDAHDEKGIAAVIRNTFMAADSPRNPDRIDYGRMLLEAGRAADISPLFLASRIVQEMGRDGSSPLAFGRLPGYEGVYNFYNIGATPNPSVPNGAQINAARYALYGLRPEEGVITPDEAVYRLPWRSPEGAITGGAIWIAQRYTAIGQDTLYLQKFDLIAADGLYTRQYAQNIQMAWAEGRRTQDAYRTAGLLDQAFTFRIPVFRSLPDGRTRLPDAAVRRPR